MSPLSLTRSHFHQVHTLSDTTLASHPDPTGRILYFALPFLFAVITNIALYARNLRVHQNNFVRVYPSNFYNLATFAIILIGTAVIGIYAVVADAWTVKEWILFTIVCVLLGLKALIYTADTNATLFITAIVTIFVALPNEWLFAELKNMAEDNQDHIGWRHATRNIIGFIEAALIIYAVEYLSESIVYIFKISERSSSLFFWIVTPLLVVGVLVLNIVSYGPFLDLIGYIVAALILFLGAAVNTLFHKDQDRESIPLKK